MLLDKIQLEKDETVLRIVRKHWWIIFVQLAGSFITMLLPLWFIILSGHWLGGTFNLATSFLETYQTEVWFIYLTWLLFNWIAISVFWNDYYLDAWVITDQRVVVVDQRGFFRRFISSFRLDRLQDINISIDGILPTLFDYGTIDAQTAGGKHEEFKSSYLPDPRGLKNLIMTAAEKRMRTLRQDKPKTDKSGL